MRPGRSSCRSRRMARATTAHSRAATGYPMLLHTPDNVHLHSDLSDVADYLANQLTSPTQVLLAEHPHIQHAFFLYGSPPT